MSGLAFSPDALNVKNEIDALIKACDTNDARVFDTLFARVRATILNFDNIEFKLSQMTETDQAKYNR